jgi:hypothetical protein
VIEQVWEDLDLSLLTKLVLSVTKRVELVIKARGRSISQYLSSHRNEATEDGRSREPRFSHVRKRRGRADRGVGEPDR